MQITIDLSDIFCSEEAPCDLQDAIKAEVVRHLTAQFKTGIERQVTTEIATVIQREIATAVTTHMPDLVSQLLDAEYRAVDRYGNRSSETTTFRNELIKAIHEQMQYKPRSSSFDENVFTKAIRDITKAEVARFQQEFNTRINQNFIKEVHDYAVKRLAERLGLKTTG